MTSPDIETKEGEGPKVQETPALTITPVAVQTIKSLLEEKQLTDHGLRVFVAGGGCSGMQYGMAFENNPQPFDAIFEVEGIRIIVDPTSMQYIRGATVDFVESLMGGGFRIENPNAVSSCGCGSSFRTEGSEQAPGYGGGGCSSCY
jgi:iron-sulfur cluster assembly protein